MRLFGINLQRHKKEGHFLLYLLGGKFYGTLVENTDLNLLVNRNTYPYNIYCTTSSIVSKSLVNAPSEVASSGQEVVVITIPNPSNCATQILFERQTHKCWYRFRASSWLLWYEVQTK